MDKVARLAKITEVASKLRILRSGKSQRIRIVEVGPRDGLQNQKKVLGLDVKQELINRLSQSGVASVEVGSFVSPKWIPQMAGSGQLYHKIIKHEGVSYPCLVPNLKGFEGALASGVKQIAIFASATQGFSQKNLNCSIRESLERFVPVMEAAKKENIKVRGYVSMVMGCPFDGEVKPTQVAWVTQQLLDLGCYEVSLGDTVGKGTVEKTQALIEAHSGIGWDRLAVHFHDTFDNAIDNILKAVQLGCRTVDSSVGGLGGCPYSMKPVGNVPTENVVYALQTAGFETGVNLEKLKETSQWICKILGRPSLSVI